MQVTYFGHSTFLVETKGKKILFDPFITHNELAKNIDVSSIKADYIIQSHGHLDHIADTLSIAQQSQATIICNWEIHDWFNKQGYTLTHPMNIGGKWQFDFGVVKCIVAHHSSSLPDGSYGGNPMGFLISNDEDCFYYAGDTALTLDMQLIPKYWGKPKVAFLPIGDNFTMDVHDAIVAAQFVECSNIVAMHYDTFGYIKVDKTSVQNQFESARLQLTLPQIGSSYSF
jgi:L-ascorbate metabolism protein UlaG (beta-lactamase superfamily)